MLRFIAAIGLGDGEGNTSSMRVFIFLILATWLGSKLAVSVQTKTAMHFDNDDLKLLGVLFGAKIAQNFQEGKPDIDVRTTSVQHVNP